MSDEDAFVGSILDDPDDDTSRLVFADWLDEHGRDSHAELIRVQCELARLPKRSREPKEKARRETLAAREKELLRQPEFSTTGSWHRQEYERGFITAIRVLDNELMAPEWAKSRWHTLLREGKALAVELHPDQGGFVSDDAYSARLGASMPDRLPEPQAESQPAQGWVQGSSRFDIPGLAGHFYQMADLAKHPILCRVTRLHLFEADLTDESLAILSGSPLLTQLREVWLGDCTISLDAFRALVTSPSIKQLRDLFMYHAEISDGRRGRGVGQLWELVASSPNMAGLERLWIGSLDNKGAAALIKSPYLKQSLRLCPDPSGSLGRAWEKSELTGKINAANVKALRERYPESRF